MDQLPERVILIGPSGSGKSELASRLAAVLKYTAIDTDELIVERTGMPISAFFQRFGEAAFRAIEATVIAESCRRSRVVIATGGGAVLSSANWAVWRPRSVVIGLIAEPGTLAARVREQAERLGDAAERPLLAGDAESRMRELLAARIHLYQSADVTINTERLAAGEVCRRAETVVREAMDRMLTPALSLATTGERSDIYIRTGGLDRAAEIARRRWPRARRVWVITDEHVAGQWGARVQDVFATGEREVRILAVPPGERSKNLRVVERLCDDMTQGGVTRRDLVLALGGGVVGDVSGFVASICLRGLALMQLPTSLLAMVDSSVGGKTGVNMPAGKNLVGSFYQPGVVVIDPKFLTTLPQAEYRSGMAEVVKHALIQPSTPFGGSELADLLRTIDLDPMPADALERVLLLNVSIKHSVVQADERESGLRMILNFGHTAGHAIEADGYRYRHGEAVAIGMVVAGRIARMLGRVDTAHVERVEHLLSRAGLPTRYDGGASEVIARLSHDKKNVDGALHWILPGRHGIERVTTVPIELVRSALIEVGAR